MRAESAKTAWHARPRCRTLIGVAALAFGLSASLTGATAAAAAPSLDLRNAPVPAGLCGHPSGHLVNGKRHLGTSGDDYLQRSYSGTIRGGATAIAVLGCNAGGVSWPQTLVFYRQLPDGSPAIVASYYLAKIRHSEHVDVHSAQIRDGRFTAVLDIGQYAIPFHQYYELCCGCN